MSAYNEGFQQAIQGKDMVNPYTEELADDYARGYADALIQIPDLLVEQRPWGQRLGNAD